MRKFVLTGIAVIVAFAGAGAPHPRRAHATPSKIWVVNQLVANAVHGSTVDFTTAAGRAAVLSELDAIELVSAGQIGLTNEVNASSGQPLVLMQTNGSGTSVTLNGRGLNCSPACDGITTATPDPADHFAVWTILDAGTHVEGDVLTVSVLQDSVLVDSAPLHVIGSHIDTFAGGGAGDGNPPTQASVHTPGGLAVDEGGALYIADQGNCRLRKVSGGVIRSVAGKGGPPMPPCASTGDYGPAIGANVQPGEVVVDSMGNAYVLDVNNCGIRKISSGVIWTAWSAYWPYYTGYCPHAVAIDASDNLLVAVACQIMRWESGAGVTPIVGSLGYCETSGDGGPAIDAGVAPTRLAVDKVNNFLYISDSLACRVRKVTLGDATPVITTVAGTGTCGSTADPGPATSAQLNAPVGVAVDSTGRLYIADTVNCRVRRVNFSLATPEIRTVAGTGVCGLTADPGQATSAQLSLAKNSGGTPIGNAAGSGLAIDGSDNLYIADTGNCLIRKVTGATISTFAGNGSCDFEDGDGGSAIQASIVGPWGVAKSGSTVYVSDTGGCRIRRIGSGIISTIAGTGTCGAGTDGVASSAMLDNPSGIALDGANNLYLSETGSCRVRRISLSASPPMITTIAGTGTCGSSVDPGPALSAQLNAPRGLTVAPNGDVYLADSGNCIIRKISGDVISTVSGTGTCAVGPSSGTALSVSLDSPTDVALDSGGNLFISDSGACVVRKLIGDALTTVAGSGNGAPGSCNPSPSDGPATSIDLGYPSGLAIDAAGDVYFGDSTGCVVRRLSGGTVSRYAGDPPGTTRCGYLGDGGSAKVAALRNPTGIALDGIGNLYIADSLNNRVRVISSGDIDGDGCGDGKEGTLVPPTDFRNRWDFYSVPVPALFIAPNPLGIFSDGIIGASDAQAVFGYFKRTAQIGSTEYEQDLNGNGIADGVEYDRSFAGPGMSGAPDGIIAASDAQVTFAQFKKGYHC